MSNPYYAFSPAELAEREAIRVLVEDGKSRWALARSQQLRRAIEKRRWDGYDEFPHHPTTAAEVRLQVQALVVYLYSLDPQLPLEATA